jgi:hypothetical protein
MKEKLLNVIKEVSDKIFIEGIYDYLFENRDNLIVLCNDELRYRCVLRDYDYVYILLVF